MAEQLQLRQQLIEAYRLRARPSAVAVRVYRIHTDKQSTNDFITTRQLPVVTDPPQNPPRMVFTIASRCRVKNWCLHSILQGNIIGQSLDPIRDHVMARYRLNPGDEQVVRGFVKNMLKKLPDHFDGEETDDEDYTRWRDGFRKRGYVRDPTRPDSRRGQMQPVSTMHGALHTDYGALHIFTILIFYFIFYNFIYRMQSFDRTFSHIRKVRVMLTCTIFRSGNGDQPQPK